MTALSSGGRVEAADSGQRTAGSGSTRLRNMREDLDQALCRDFPNTFRDRHASMQNTCMCWGFPGDGWEPLIRRAAAKIEAAIGRLHEKERVDVTSTQVKEKYGTLRWYMRSSNDEIEAAIDEAEQESERTCEECGAPGTTNTRGWLVTLCGRCRKRKASAAANADASARAAAGVHCGTPSCIDGAVCGSPHGHSERKQQL